MRVTIYLLYPLRSLFRGGLRAALAIFCIAIGVTALVSLQSVGAMIQQSVTVNARDANGGDITIQAGSFPFAKDDLNYFANLKQQGTITNYTAGVFLTGELSLQDAAKESFLIYVVDPAHFPLVVPPAVQNPTGTTFVDLLKNGQAVVSQSFIDRFQKHVGDSFDVHADTNDTLQITLGGVVDNSSVAIPALGRGVIFLPEQSYATMHTGQVLYDFINVTTSDAAHADKAAQLIQDQFPDASLRLPGDALQSVQDTVGLIKNLLEISGLLALLLGGVGIINTMQVLISRRKVEIAMLKATGYRRLGLCILFGTEAGLLGLTGGVIGAGAGAGVSTLVRSFVANLLKIEIPFVLNPVIVGGGVVLGCVTALIFGLLPIIQGSGVRPLEVIRDLPESRNRGILGRILQVVLLIGQSLLLCGVAIVILDNNVLLGVISVYGGFVFLGALSLFFSLVVIVISKLPVPSHINLKSLGVLLIGIALAAGLYFFVNTSAAIVVSVAVLLELCLMLIPRTWKANIKMALRNLGRRRGRTVATMLVLFVGIFSISLITILGQDLREALNKPRQVKFNVIAVTTGKDTSSLHNSLSTVPGLSATIERPIVRTIPIAINNQPIKTLFALHEKRGLQAYTAFQQMFQGIEGYDVAQNQLPNAQDYHITGRSLEAQDNGTDRVVVDSRLMNLEGVQLHIGDQVTLANLDRSTQKTVTIVGFYQGDGVDAQPHMEPVWAPAGAVRSLQPQKEDQSVFFMRVDANQVSNAINDIGTVAPTVVIRDLTHNNSDFFNQLLADILSTLTIIASFSMLAGVVIIANAVALAMLERKREMAILKSVGYTRGFILGEVLLENGLLGGIGALMALLLVALTLNPLGQFFLSGIFRLSNFTYQLNGVVVISLIAGSTVLAMIAAALVAWGTIRVRPIEVLRYE